MPFSIFCSENKDKDISGSKLNMTSWRRRGKWTLEKVIKKINEVIALTGRRGL
jgi:hypothetical protein